jgi:hypothetical protein
LAGPIALVLVALARPENGANEANSAKMAANGVLATSETRRTNPTPPRWQSNRKIE